MNIYLNSEQEAYLKELLDKPSLEVSHKFGELINQQIKAKLNKKKIDKKAQLPTESFIDKDGRELTFFPRKDNGALILKGNKDNYKKFNGHFSYNWSYTTSIQLANYLHNYAVFTGDDDYEVYTRSYSEEFNVFKDEVERSIDVQGSNLSFICYTNETDNDWTYLLPGRVKEYLRLLVAYIFIQKELDLHFSELHPGIQKLHKEWLIRYALNEK